jgi:hypothetical protein
VHDGETVVLSLHGYRSVALPENLPDDVIDPIRSILCG